VTLLERQKGFDAGMLHLIGEHHALLDGSGYPPETRGEFTSDRTRILVITDRYDELITGFGGATPLAPHQALQRLYREAQEGKLDKDILSRFIKTVGIYPVHSCVRLNTKELAIVTDLNPSRLHQPIVTITHEPGGNGYPAPFVVNLALQGSQPPERAIDSVVDTALSAPAYNAHAA
jgi:HD-GYP domain-containing protein (c-di-GMP phosphodiesterase class II)